MKKKEEKQPGVSIYGQRGNPALGQCGLSVTEITEE